MADCYIPAAAREDTYSYEYARPTCTNLGDAHLHTDLDTVDDAINDANADLDGDNYADQHLDAHTHSDVGTLPRKHASRRTQYWSA